MPTFTRDGRALAFDDHGDRDAPPLVLLHGFTGAAADWRHVFTPDGLDALARTHRVIATDAREHGRSSQTGAIFTHRDCALDLLALLDHLGLARVRAIGLSLGGNTLLHAATIAPARFEAMIVVSATTHFTDATRAAMRAFGHPQATAWAASTDDMAFTPAQLAAITARTLIVTGDRDPLYPVEIGVALYRAIADARLWVVPGGGHGPIFGEDAPAFAAAARAFLGEA
jgi:pimeloyl-ACP methyl ester carboxylesterase